MYKSPLGALNEGIESAHKAYKAIACDILGVDSEELDRIVSASLQTISLTTTIGWQIGSLIGGPEGALIGAGIGAAIGIVIVVGAITYLVYFRRNDDGSLMAVPQVA